MSLENIYCPKCKKITKKNGYHLWQIIISVCFFPIGLIVLDADKKPTVCEHCRHTWIA